MQRNKKHLTSKVHIALLPKITALTDLKTMRVDKEKSENVYSWQQMREREKKSRIALYDKSFIELN